MNQSADAGPGVAALRELVMPVVVVVAGDHGETACATSTTSYVSLRPAVLSVALIPTSRTARMVTRTGKFSVSVLAADQADLARRAGRSAEGPDKLAALGIGKELPPVAGQLGEPGPPGVLGAAAVLWCEISDTLTVGDHLVVFGQVSAVRGAIGGGGEDPGLLLRHHRRYLGTGQPVTPPVPDGYPI